MSMPSFQFHPLACACLLAIVAISQPAQAQSHDTVCATPATMIADQGHGDLSGRHQPGMELVP